MFANVLRCTFCRNRRFINSKAAEQVASDRIKLSCAKIYSREKIIETRRRPSRIVDASSRIYKVPSRTIYLSGRMQESCNRIHSLSSLLHVSPTLTHKRLLYTKRLIFLLLKKFHYTIFQEISFTTYLAY